MIDVTTSLAGPYCTEVLAALGADVIKIEPIDGGDEARAWGPPFWNGESTMFLAMNAGKRSVTLDLRAGLDVLLRLADDADVFVQSLRPGAADERGFGPDVLRGRNPRLVYATIGAFGAQGTVERAAGLRPAGPGRGRHSQRHRRRGTAGSARRRVVDRPEHRRLDRARRRRGVARARADGQRTDDRRLAVTRRRSRCSRTRSPATSAAGRCPAGTARPSHRSRPTACTRQPTAT